MVTPHLTPFIGRERDLAEIAALLVDPACRLLTLVGPGGIGKTRLAVEAVSRSLSPFMERGSGGEVGPENATFPVHFVPLQPVADASLIPIAIANALGVQFFGADEPRVQLLHYLQNRHMLLILDNFEHLLEGVDFVVELLTAPGVKLLVTSRIALNVQAEWRYAVGGLDVPPSPQTPPDKAPGFHLPHGEGLQATVDGFENLDAVRLFTERARHLRHDFDPANHRADLIRICQLTEGMPLALELAAGWLRALSCAQITNEIQRNLDFLAADVRDVPERHRSMAAAFVQSWRLLTDDEQKIFRRMSVFRGGFTREAAENVAGATLQSLASLADKSFVRVDAEGRYDIHELMRQYGEAKLEAAGEVEAIRDAHSAYYLDFLAQRANTIHSHTMVEVLDEIEADFDNIRVAWYRAVAKRDDQSIGRAVEALTWYCDRRGHLYEHEELYTHAQERFAPAPDEQPLLAWAQLMIRRAAMIIGLETSDEKLPLAGSLAEKSLAVVRLYHHLFERAYTAYRWANFRATRNHPDALALHEACLVDFQALGSEFYMSECLFWIAFIYRQNKRYDQFFHSMRQCADLKLHLGDKNGAAHAFMHMSVTHYSLADLAASERDGEEARQLYHEVGNQLGLSTTLTESAVRAFFKGDLERSYALCQEAAKYLSAKNNPYEISFLGMSIALINGILTEDYEQCMQEVKELGKLYPQHLNDPPYLNGPKLVAFCGLKLYEEARRELSVFFGKFKELFRTMMASVLGFTAIIFAHRNQETCSVEIFSLLFAQPIELVGWLKRWGLVTRLLARLHADLGEKTYTEAWERGKNFDLETTFAEIAAEFGVSQDALVQKPLDSLTPRELEVLRLLVDGLSNAQIAERLVISVGTAKTHIHNIYSKLGVESRAQAIVRIRELGLI